MCFTGHASEARLRAEPVHDHPGERTWSSEWTSFGRSFSPRTPRAAPPGCCPFGYSSCKRGSAEGTRSSDRGTLHPVPRGTREFHGLGASPSRALVGLCEAVAASRSPPRERRPSGRLPTWSGEPNVRVSPRREPGRQLSRMYEDRPWATLPIPLDGRLFTSRSDFEGPVAHGNPWRSASSGPAQGPEGRPHRKAPSEGREARRTRVARRKPKKARTPDDEEKPMGASGDRAWQHERIATDSRAEENPGTQPSLDGEG